MPKLLKQDKSELVPRRSSRLLLIGCFTYLIASCFYAFPSGRPQPADYIMACIMFLAIVAGSIKMEQQRALFITAFLACLYFSFIGLYYFSKYEDFHFIISPIYYIYNSVIMMLFAAVCQTLPNESKKVFGLAAILIIIIEVIAVALELRFHGVRSTGTFNDPNQLGYMIILVLMVKFISKENNNMNGFDLFCIVGSAYIILKTQSRSAAIGWTLIMFWFIIFLNLVSKLRLTAIIVAIVGLVGIWFSINGMQKHISNDNLLVALFQRFSESDYDDSLRGRGYFLLMEYPEYLMTGAGEGGWFRFMGGVRGGEIHSTWANIMFSYGIIGFALFCAILFIVFRHAAIFHIFLFMGPVGYGIGTYGARFSMFWVVLGLVYGLAQARREWKRSEIPVPLSRT